MDNLISVLWFLLIGGFCGSLISILFAIHRSLVHLNESIDSFRMELYYSSNHLTEVIKEVSRDE